MNKPTIIGIVLLVLIVAGGIGYRFLSNGSGTPGDASTGKAGSISYSANPSPLAITTVGAYTLPTVELDGEQVPLIRIPLVTWGGYAALFAANGGSAPSKSSLFYQKGKFVVELVREEDPAVHLDGYTKGTFPIIWSTMDSLPLLFNALKGDSRVIPQVFGLFDWSFGGDGIIVRDDIKTPKDLKGKRVVTSGNSPSHFFLLWLLGQSGLSPSDLSILYVADALSAKDAFMADPSIDACVTWSPFIYEITDPSSANHVEGSRLLITSRDANQLIADVYLARRDFFRENPAIIKAFSEAMFAGADLLAQNPEPTYAAMAQLFQLQGGPAEAKAAVGDTHVANFPENVMFFALDNAINAFKIFYMAQEYYKGTQSLPADAAFEAERVINLSFLEELTSQGAFANQVNGIINSFNKQSNFDIADLESQRVVLTEDINIYFEAQRIDFDLGSNRPEIEENKQELGQIVEQMEVLGTTVIKLVGHLDTSKLEEFKAQGQQAFIEANAQAKLISKKRAEFIKQVLVETYGADPSRIITEGKGWDAPIDAADPARNRRVEVRFLAFE